VWVNIRVRWGFDRFEYWGKKGQGTEHQIGKPGPPGMGASQKGEGVLLSHAGVYGKVLEWLGENRTRQERRRGVELCTRWPGHPGEIIHGGAKLGAREEHDRVTKKKGGVGIVNQARSTQWCVRGVCGEKGPKKKPEVLSRQKMGWEEKTTASFVVCLGEKRS